MKFKFNLEVLRKHKKNLEEMARRDFSIAKENSDGILGKIDEYYNSNDRTRERMGNESKKDFVDQNLLQISNEFIERNKIRIDNKKVEFREALLVTEEKQERLIEAAQETKVLDKLKEKKQELFRKKLRKLDRKATDEVVVQRHSRWGKNEE